MDAIKLNNIAWLHALWVVAALFGVVAWGFNRKRRALARFATPNLLGYLMPNVSIARQWTKALLILAALSFTVFGMIDPRWGMYYEDIKRRGVDVIFCLDVSRSMLAEDVKPNRLERAKQYIRDMVEVMGGDRVGLIAFAGKPGVKCPLTVNYGAFRMVLDETDVRSAGRGGTLIGDAIRLAIDSFVDQVKGYKTIIVLTDGEDQDSYPVEAARKAFDERGIRTYAIGLGDASQGQRIPVEKDGQRVFLQHEGQEVWSKMNPQSLRDVAEAGHGAYIPAGTRQVDMGQLFTQRISTADQREFETAHVPQHHVQFQWFAGAALLLLLIESLMTDRRAAAKNGLSEYV